MVGPLIAGIATGFAQASQRREASNARAAELLAKQQEAQQGIEKAKLEGAQQERDNDKMNKEKDRETQIKVAMIHAEDNNKRVEVDSVKTTKETQVKDKDVDVRRQSHEEVVRSNKANEEIKRSELGIKKKEAAVKKQDVANKLKIAKQKPKSNS